MPSGTLNDQTALTTPESDMILYAVLDPFNTLSDRKITANNLFATITKNIADISLQFDDGLGTATVSAAGKGKIRYNNTAKKFQASYDGAAYVDLGSSSGPGTPGAPGQSVQFNDAGSFGGNASFLYTPTGARNVELTSTANNRVPMVIKGFSDSNTARLFAIYNDSEVDGLEFDVGGNTNSGDNLSIFRDTDSASIGAQTQNNASDASAVFNAWVNVGAATFGANNSHTANTTLATIPSAGVLFTGTSGLTGGLVLIARTASSPIIFGTGGDTFASERGRFDSNGLTLGKASTSNGKLTLAVSGSANTQSHTAPAAPASTLTFVWPSADPTAGQQLTASAPVAGVVTLTWT